LERDYCLGSPLRRRHASEPPKGKEKSLERNTSGKNLEGGEERFFFLRGAGKLEFSSFPSAQGRKKLLPWGSRKAHSSKERGGPAVPAASKGCFLEGGRPSARTLAEGGGGCSYNPEGVRGLRGVCSLPDVPPPFWGGVGGLNPFGGGEGGGDSCLFFEGGRGRCGVQRVVEASRKKRCRPREG